MVGGFTSDKSNFEELIYCFENRDKSRPFFAFNVTIQNHSGYWDQTPVTVELEKIGNTETHGFGEVKEFLSLMKLTDDALRMLIEYFEKVEEPVIVCMFGDHQPYLEVSDIFYDRIFEGTGLTEEEQTIRKHITPYLIWANYDIGDKEYGDVSASYLAPILCETAGLKMPVYYQFLLNMREEIPYFNRYNYEQYSNMDFMRQYRILQYNHLMERDYRRDVFSVEEAFSGQ